VGSIIKWGYKQVDWQFATDRGTIDSLLFYISICLSFNMLQDTVQLIQTVVGDH
jgi:hypothetical protein